MTSSRGNIFRVTGLFWGGNPQNIRLSKQQWSWWFDAPSRPLWRHRNEKSLSCEIRSWKNHWKVFSFDPSEYVGTIGTNNFQWFSFSHQIHKTISRCKLLVRLCSDDKLGHCQITLLMIGSICVVLHHAQQVLAMDSRFTPSQWQMGLLCNDVSHWLGANLESALFPNKIWSL